MSVCACGSITGISAKMLTFGTSETNLECGRLAGGHGGPQEQPSSDFVRQLQGDCTDATVRMRDRGFSHLLCRSSPRVQERSYSEKQEPLWYTSAMRTISEGRSLIPLDVAVNVWLIRAALGCDPWSAQALTPPTWIKKIEQSHSCRLSAQTPAICGSSGSRQTALSPTGPR